MLLSVPHADVLVQEPPALDEVRLDALSEREWRVIDTRFEEHDAPCVLGFIERTDESYETLVIGKGLSRWDFTGLEEARAFFTRNREARR